MLGQRRLRRLINDPADGDRNEQQEGHTDEIPFCNVFTVGSPPEVPSTIPSRSTYHHIQRPVIAQTTPGIMNVIRQP